ncbi:MAG: thiamine phosphate synthase [Spirochaetes bacterium]|jgi:thiamine-phosphate pyrophosphorylase|nr:thiamine phosphate synthase [Spirochaetota bacterium]
MERGIYSAIDACLNRALEGIRVCEDVMRFCSRDSGISTRLKGLRHGVLEEIRRIPGEWVLGGRDVEGDAQRFVDLPGEMSRGSLGAVFSSNLHRAAEAVRTLEEMMKLASASHPECGDSPASCRRIRFELYSVEKEAVSLLDRSGRSERIRNTLYAILDSKFIPENGYADAARVFAGAGAGVIQLRMKDVPGGRVLETAKSVASVCREKGVLFIVNDHPGIAALSGADGVHLGQDDIPVNEARRLLPGGMIIGISTHSYEQALSAVGSGPDYIAVGPVYGTSSKNGEDMPPVGLDAVRRISALTRMPVVGIGGISPDRIGELFEAGCDSAAVISWLYREGGMAENCAGLADSVRKHGR